MCGELDPFMKRTVNTFWNATAETNIKNVKAYMKSIIWNAFTEDSINCDEYEWIAS